MRLLLQTLQADEQQHSYDHWFLLVNDKWGIGHHSLILGNEVFGSIKLGPHLGMNNTP